MSVDASEDLYGLPLDAFVPARVALVKALRAEKRREDASRIAALRKPSVAAWAVNQLVRSQPKALHALFGAGDDLAQAQARAAAGKGGGDAMREATHRQRDAVRELVEAAERVLSSAGQSVSQATTERIGETFRAAANDEEARRQVAEGCLTRELRFVGVGIGGLAPSSVETMRRGAPTPAKEHADRRGSQARRANAERDADRQAEGEAESDADRQADRRAERVAARERAAALKAARRSEAEARRAATRAQKELAAAEARHEEAVASLQGAETLRSVAAQRAQDAVSQLTVAEQAVKDLVSRRRQNR